MSKDSRDYIELAQPWSSLRLCRELEKKFPNLQGCQLEIMKHLCSIACKSEDYLDVCRDAWRRTTISFCSENNPIHVFSAESTECIEMAKIMSQISNERDIRCEKLMQGLVVPKITSKVEIRSNILPGGSYLERLKELESQSFWTRVHNMLIGTSCCISKRGFFPTSILDQACETENVSLMEKVNEWRVLRGGRCCLAMHLEENNEDTKDSQGCLTPRTALQEIALAEIEEVRELGRGSEGSVHQVLWNNRMYARKSCERSFKTEETVALRVLHPHVATAFGYSVNVDVDEYGDSDGAGCLLMEMMTEDLSRMLNRDVEPRSRVESLDVLLQVGMAMDHMHTKNVVHGDLKPLNILISPFEVSGTERYLLAKVTDFDQAQFKTPDKDLEVKGRIGSTQYTAPEVLSLQKDLKWESDFKCSDKLDVYSFGVVAYEVLTGCAPDLISQVDKKRAHDDMKRVIKGDLTLKDSEKWKNLIKKRRYPVEVIELVEKCWELDPEKRPSFSEIWPKIKKCKSMVQGWEKHAADIWNRYVFVAVCLIAFIYYFIF